VGAKEFAVYCSVDLLLCVGHIRTVLQVPVMTTCFVLTTCLLCVKTGWHQRPKIHRAVA
jgi:urea transporter